VGTVGHRTISEEEINEKEVLKSGVRRISITTEAASVAAFSRK
jgi:hypothetical protein